MSPDRQKDASPYLLFPVEYPNLAPKELNRSGDSEVAEKWCFTMERTSAPIRSEDIFWMQDFGIISKIVVQFEFAGDNRRIWSNCGVECIRSRSTNESTAGVVIL